MEYLGVSAARGVLWNSLINTLVSKCKIMMVMIKRAVGYVAPITATSYLYSALGC